MKRLEAERVQNPYKKTRIELGQGANTIRKNWPVSTDRIILRRQQKKSKEGNVDCGVTQRLQAKYMIRQQRQPEPLKAYAYSSNNQRINYLLYSQA